MIFLLYTANLNVLLRNTDFGFLYWELIDPTSLNIKRFYIFHVIWELLLPSKCNQG